MKIFKQSSIKINNIYFDPYMIDENYNDAKYIFITHSHYDHFSVDDISKVMNTHTKFICPLDVGKSLVESGIDENKVILVIPGNEYKIDELEFKTMYAYNNHKIFHPKKNGWVGYLINIDGIAYYIAGDTDYVNENMNIKCDVAFVPIGGKFTMDFKEAAEFINTIKPKKVIPIHYGIIVGKSSFGDEFKKLINEEIEVELIKCY